MKYIFILNPEAGKNRKALSLIPDIQKICDHHKLEYEIHISKSGDGITDFVRHCCESGEEHRFYAFGGDGTLNNVVNGCAEFDNAEVGVVPLGTGNDFIKNFDVEEKEFFDIEKQIFSASHIVDAIKCNGRYCINMCNVGLDANIGMEMPRFKKIPFMRNKGAYGLSVAYNVTKKLGRPMEIYADGQPLLCGEMMMCAISNGTSCGGGFYVTPKAKVNDGFIDISAVEPPPSFGKYPVFIKQFLAATHLDCEELKPYIHFKKCMSAKIVSKEKFAFVNDGEPEYSCELNFEIVPSCIKFIIPQEIL